MTFNDIGARLLHIVLAFGGSLLLPMIPAAKGDEHPADHGLEGTSIRMLDLNGRVHLIGEENGTCATAIVFLSTECPIARQYIPELNRIHERFAGKSIEFYGVVADPSTTREQVVEFASEFGVKFPVLIDSSFQLARLLLPTHVPEAFVLDGQRRLVYRGRIDDQYREVGRRSPTVNHHDLIDAIEAALSGETPAVRYTEPVGCPLVIPSADELLEEVTFHRHIAPIVFANCSECHREGEVAPFKLLSYDDCAKRAKWLADVAGTKLMPPWMAEAGHGDFVASRSLEPVQIKMLRQWYEAGMPEGDEADRSPAPQFADGWRLGKPSTVLQVPHPTVVPADGPDIFQHYVIPVDIPEDKTLIGFEFHPGNPAVVHHVVLFYDMMGTARVKDAKTPEPGYRTFGSPGVPVSGVIGVWVPGMSPRFLPEGIGMHIPKGAELLIQLHLHPSGKEEVDQSTIGLYFDEDRDSEIRTMSRVPLSSV